MKQTSRFSRPFLTIALFLLLGSCHKEDQITAISGTLISKVSGQPIQHASLQLQAYDGYNHDSSHRKIVDTRLYSADEQGHFLIEYRSNSIDGFYAFVIPGSDYLPPVYSLGAEFGQVRDYGVIRLDTFIHPATGVIRITAKNVQDTTRNIWYKTDMINAPLENNKWKFEFPLDIQPGLPSVKTYPVLANQQVHVYWDFHAFSGGNSAHRDSIYCAEKDTVDYEIDF